jgi:hypothetical protein
MGWLSTLLKKSDNSQAPVPDTGIHDWDNEPLSKATMPSDLGAAIALINDAALQTVIAYGLPEHWFSFETVTVTNSEKTYFQLQILMNHWDMQMCAHSYAFECAVIKKIRKKDLDIGRALRAVLWRVAPDAGCPFDEMPAPSYWTAQAITQRNSLRERIQREFYAATTPESGAKPAKPAIPAKAVYANVSAPIEVLNESLGYSDTHPHNLNGFSHTHPHTKPHAKAYADRFKTSQK